MDILEKLRRNAEGLERHMFAAEIAAGETAVRVREPEVLLANLKDGAAEIERLRGELERLSEERSYVVGFNDGWDHAAKVISGMRKAVVLHAQTIRL